MLFKAVESETLRNQHNCLKMKRVRLLDSVEVVERRIPIDSEDFFAFWVSTNEILFHDFTVKAAS
jgi:hypothetical protein